MIRVMRAAMTAALIMLAGASKARAQAFSRDFEGYRFAIALPAGFHLYTDPDTSDATSRVYTFSREHQDGARTMVQIMLFDLGSAAESVSVDEFTRHMTHSWQKDRSSWRQDTKSTVLGDAPARLIRWSAVVTAHSIFQTKSGYEHGVMILCVESNFGIALIGENVLPLDDSTLSSVERAFHTFTMAPIPLPFR